MGIRGLTTFISQNSDRFHEDLQLHDCTVVIDGSSLAHRLYSNYPGCNSAFGGDYDRFAESLENFFSLLQRCKIIPLVIVDGGYEARKMKTRFARLRSKINCAKSCNPSNQSSSPVFPLLMMEVFKQTLSNLRIRFAQADFEADFEIAALAKYLNCPVMSYDSDFYVFDVKYIPFSTVNQEVSSFQTDGHVQHYLSCEMYVVDHFISNFGGLDKSLLPVMAILLGNDYVPSSVFSKFYNHVKMPKGKKLSPQQRRIGAVFEWLRKETLSSSVKRILSHLKKEDRQHVENLIELSIKGYAHCQSSLLSYLGLEAREDCYSEKNIPQHLSDFEEETDAMESSEEFAYSDEGNDGDDQDSIMDSENENKSCDEDEVDWKEKIPDFVINLNFPPWLRDKFRKGEIPSFISDIYHLHIYFCQPQVEDFALLDSHTVSFPLLRYTCGFLLGDKTKSSEESNHVVCYSRCSSSKLQKIEIHPTFNLPFLKSHLGLTSLIDLAPITRKRVLFYSLGITCQREMEILESFGEKWALFASVVVFWARSGSSPSVTNCHLHSIVTCMLALGVIDKKISRIRHLKEIRKRRIAGNKEMDVSLPAQNREKFHGSDIKNVNDLQANVLASDCLAAAQNLLDFHRIDDKLRSRPRLFSPQVVHVFSQLQTCLLQAMTLNALLDFPLPQCMIAETFSGIVTYMAYSNFEKRKDVETYIRHTLFSKSPSVLNMYNILWDKYSQLLPDLKIVLRKGKRKRVKKSSATVYPQETSATPDDDSEFEFDANNKFSLLAVR